MKLQKVIIHNFRSILDATFEVSNYSLIVGENNVGKTNLLSALRIFYEDGGLKFDRSRDWPKIKTDDDESWIELHFKTTDEEQKGLREEYRSSGDNILKVCKYLASDDKDKQSNIYAYENNKLSENIFYGAPNVSLSKIGSIVYIPAVNKVEDTLKTSGASPFRNLINMVMKKVVANSEVYRKLDEAFSEFNQNFKKTEKGKLSIDVIKDSVNKELLQWGVEMDIEVSAFKPEDIVKNFIKPHIEEHKLEQRIDISSVGQGLQRHLIYTLLKISSKYNTSSKSINTDSNKDPKKDFNPDYTLLLFEEPEAFLHPLQQNVLFRSLKELGNTNTQVIVSTHSPQFVGKSTDDLKSIIRLHRSNKDSVVHQLTEDSLQEILSDNLDAVKGVGGTLDLDDETKLALEGLKYFLWLDSERSSLFFARHVLLCEGATEKIYFDYLADNEDSWKFLRDERVYVMNCLGKYNLHRYIHLLTKLGIPHSVIFDGDSNKKEHPKWNKIVGNARTSLTFGIHQFDNDIEAFLGIPEIIQSDKKQKRNDLKPINILKKHVERKIDSDKENDIRKIVMKVLKPVFYSFHFKPDNWRASQVRQMGVLEGNEPATDNDWEKMKGGDDTKIKKWIDDQMFGKSCVVVLVGQHTASCEWVKYEIKKAWDDGKGVVGIHIHKLTDIDKKQASKGENPFELIEVGNNDDKLSTIAKCYDVEKTDSKEAYDAIKSNLVDWLEEAIKIRNDYNPETKPMEAKC